jgi:transglycosylase-like protein
MASIARLTLATLIASAPAIAQGMDRDPRFAARHTAMSWNEAWTRATAPQPGAARPAQGVRAANSRAANSRAAGKRRLNRRQNAVARPIPQWLRNTLDAIAHCESRGNPRAVSAGGTYRGKYQFDLTTWSAVGGRGDPAAAPEAVQDRMAARLYRMRGAAPWPVCGR